MSLYLLFIEPLLLFLEKRISGHFLPNLRTIDAFCDDLNVMTNKEENLMVVDSAVTKFESIRGAVLSRNRKCEILEFGRWKERNDWPLGYFRPVKETKIFGIIISNTYKQMLQKN